MLMTSAEEMQGLSAFFCFDFNKARGAIRKYIFTYNPDIVTQILTAEFL